MLTSRPHETWCQPCPTYPRKRLLNTFRHAQTWMKSHSGLQNRSSIVQKRISTATEHTPKRFRSVRTGFKRTQRTSTYKTDRRVKSAASQNKISNVSAQLSGCYLVCKPQGISPTKSILTPMSHLFSACHLPSDFHPKMFQMHKMGTLEIHNCSKTYLPSNYAV